MAHFLGLHALQMLPLLALLFAARGWPEVRRIRMVWAISASYVSLFGLLLWQALRGQSVTAPDAATLTAMAFVAGVAVPTAFAVVYTVIMAMQFFGSEGGFSSLPDVARLFTNPWLLLAGWIHYLAFDLLIGSWEARDARERGVHHLLVIRCLIVTFMFGPAGWLLYLGVRSRSENR